MSSSGFGGGFLQGLAESYAQGNRMHLETQMAQRKNVWDTLSAALPNARPEAQVKIFQKLAGLASTPIHKKLDKSITDFSDLMEPPPGFGPPGGESIKIGGEGFESSIGNAPEPTYAPVPLTGAGGMHGTARVPTNVEPPPVMSTPVQTGSPFEIGKTPVVQPPAYSPWYSPEEQGQIKSHQAAMQAGEAVRQTIAAQRAAGEDLGLKGGDLARYSLGSPPLVARTQTKNFRDKNGNAVQLAYDPIQNIYLDSKQNEVDPTELGYAPIAANEANVMGDLVPDQNSLTGWSRTIRDPISKAVLRLEPGAPPPPGYAATTTTSAYPIVNIDSQGHQVVTNATRQTTTQRAVPGAAPALTPPPPVATTGSPRANGIVNTPKGVEEAGTSVRTAEQRLASMVNLEKDAKAGNQQDQIAILAAHMGMTGGIVPGVRIGATFWEEAENSAPWISRLLASVTAEDPNTGERVVISPLSGIKLTKGQIDQMIDLARKGVDRARETFEKTKKDASTGYGYGPGSQPTATKAQVQQYATQHNITYARAKQEFQSKGIIVDEGR